MLRNDYSYGSTDLHKWSLRSFQIVSEIMNARERVRANLRVFWIRRERRSSRLMHLDLMVLGKQESFCVTLIDNRS